MSKLVLINHSKFYAPLRNAMEHIGYEFHSFNWGDDLLLFEGAEVCILSFYDCLKFPFKVFMLRRWLKKRNIPLFVWNRDAPHYLNKSKWKIKLLAAMRVINIYATHSFADEVNHFGEISLYLPNAANIDAYNLRKDKSEVFACLRDFNQYKWDVSFFGGMDGDKHKEDVERLVFLKELSLILDSYDISYCFKKSDAMSVDDQISFIHDSKINLNVGARCEYGLKRPFAFPERCYGIPAVAGFILCDKRVHSQDDFSIGENWVEFDGVEDCAEKIKYWLQNFSSARNIAENCYSHVMLNHTYLQRAKKIEHAISEWRRGVRGILK
jgi:spore maturation protein CgeB